jgi:hypothetical protein
MKVATVLIRVTSGERPLTDRLGAKQHDKNVIPLLLI